MSLLCRLLGHKFLGYGGFVPTYTCPTQNCLRWCGAQQITHATVRDDYTDAGFGGCRHGTPGDEEIVEGR